MDLPHWDRLYMLHLCTFGGFLYPASFNHIKRREAQRCPQWTSFLVPFPRVKFCQVNTPSRVNRRMYSSMWGAVLVSSQVWISRPWRENEKTKLLGKTSTAVSNRFILPTMLYFSRFPFIHISFFLSFFGSFLGGGHSREMGIVIKYNQNHIAWSIQTKQGVLNSW